MLSCISLSFREHETHVTLFHLCRIQKKHLIELLSVQPNRDLDVYLKHRRIHLLLNLAGVSPTASTSPLHGAVVFKKKCKIVSPPTCAHAHIFSLLNEHLSTFSSRIDRLKIVANLLLSSAVWRSATRDNGVAIRNHHERISSSSAASSCSARVPKVFAAIGSATTNGEDAL